MQSIFTKKLQLVSCQILNYLFRLGRISAAEKNETIDWNIAKRCPE